MILAVGVRPAAAEVDGGGWAGAFLQLSWSARVAGMGSAFVGVADDAEGGLFNPAGSIILEKRHFTASHRFMTLDRRMNFVSFIRGINKDAGLGVSWINVGVGEIEQRNSNGELIGNIRDFENLIALTFAKRIGKEILMGVNIKYDQHTIANVSANGLGFDFGVMWGENKPYRVGAVVQNVGLNHRWSTGDFWNKPENGILGGSTTKDEFPLIAKLGGSYRLYQNRVLVALDLEKTEQQSFLIHAGGEGWVNQYLALRAGFNRDNFTLGAGIKYKWEKYAATLNYAFLPGTSGLDPDNLISLSVEF